MGCVVHKSRFQAASYMNIDCLLHLCAAKLASLIKGKTKDEVEEVFNLDAQGCGVVVPK